MSIDRSLRSLSTLSRHRNVLTRAERITLLKDEGEWEESQGVLGLRKVGHRKPKVGKKKAKTAEETAAEGAAVGEAAKPAK
jgi:small basic protein (TIGR04137 family)